MKYAVTLIRLFFLALFLILITNGNMMLWLGLFAVSLMAALIFGRVYCGYVCPMNTLMISAEWLSKKLKLQTKNKPKWLKNGYFAWIALVVSAAAMLISKRILHINLPILPIWLVISVLITFIYKPAVFHNLICPFGILQRTFGKFARLSKKVNEDACIGCKLCEKSCPSDAIAVIGEDKKAVINTELCHQCTNCQQVCPKNAIHYSKQKQ
ncbi:4Fe-4S binding protein [Dehalobacterium formicoaceticum]|uniref:4Fe-4S binding protein n=1 Tax=Dehalobacterium formicoaceticum TaxID=51515 RepID=UPI0031F68784